VEILVVLRTDDVFVAAPLSAIDWRLTASASPCRSGRSSFSTTHRIAWGATTSRRDRRSRRG